MITRRLLILVTLVLTFFLVTSSFGIQNSIEIYSHGIITYPEKEFANCRIYVDGTQIKNEFGERINLKGVNINTATWWSQKSIDIQQQISHMKDWGINTLRVTITGWAISEWESNTSFRDKLDDIITWAENKGIYIILSGYHLTEGGSFPYNSDISTWGNVEWTKWIEHWKLISIRYKNKTNILYDLLNEPLGVQSKSLYQTKIQECIDTIREIDQDVVCIVEAMSLDKKFLNLSFEFEQTHPINRENIIFSGHLYQNEWRKDSTKAAIRSLMEYKKWDWIVENNRCLWIGEFNTENQYVNDSTYRGENWLRNFMDICYEDGYSGFAAWYWNNEGRYALLKDWNSSPSASGSILIEYLD